MKFIMIDMQGCNIVPALIALKLLNPNMLTSKIAHLIVIGHTWLVRHVHTQFTYTHT